jgi:hypothetical protein
MASDGQRADTEDQRHVAGGAVGGKNVWKREVADRNETYPTRTTDGLARFMNVPMPVMVPMVEGGQKIV